MSRHAIDVYSETACKYIGNPSSTHPLGQEAKARLDEERAHIAGLLGVKAKDVYFTSGGTESDSIVLSSLLQSPSPGEIITTGIEHSAVLEFRKTLENAGWKFTAIRCPGGYLNLEDLRAALNDKVRMVCLMKVNNVTGTVLDTVGAVKIVREYSRQIGRPIHIHCDAVQALGKIPFNPEQEDLDSAAFSAHKFCGPRGVGILWCRSKAISSLSRGGGQEKGLRAGTENLAGICAMGAALEDITSSIESNYNKVYSYRESLVSAVRECGFKIISPVECGPFESPKASPYILNISVRPVPSEVFLRVMSDKGFCLSAGSACSSNSRGKAESVLAAMNTDPMDRMSSIRISIGADNTDDQVQGLCNALRQARQELGLWK